MDFAQVRRGRARHAGKRLQRRSAAAPAAAARGAARAWGGGVVGGVLTVVLSCAVCEQKFLKANGGADDWKKREAGILALGAIAEGAMGPLGRHLPDLVLFLVRTLEDPKACC